MSNESFQPRNAARDPRHPAIHESCVCWTILTNVYARTVREKARLGWWLFLTALSLAPAFAQTPKAIVVDGPGPWRNGQWVFTTAEFTSILTDAGYAVTTVSPVDIPSALTSPDILLAVPSLESLPFDTFTAIAAGLNCGFASSSLSVSLMASGGEPFRDPLYLTPDGKWLDAAAYQATVGTPPAQGPFMPPFCETLSPWYMQYTTSSGLRVPIVHVRGITSEPAGRTSIIGDLLSPAATLYTFYASSPFPNGPTTKDFLIWLPSPQLADPFRAQLVAALHANQSGLHLLSSGPDQIAWLPGETITGQVNIFNTSSTPVQASLQWSVSSGSGVIAQPSVTLSLAAGLGSKVPLKISALPVGNYTLTFHLMLGNEEMDRIDSPVRVLDPASSRQPDQKIRVVNGAFYANGQRVYLHGVNYWPRYAALLPLTISWLEPQNYDPDQVEADLSLLASLHFNLINIQYVDPQPDWQQQARSLLDFLERCRNHGIWVRISLPATLGNNAYAGSLNPGLGSFLEAAYLPGNDRVFAYELLWEPFIGFQNQGGYGGYLNGTYVTNVGRAILDPYWRTWVNDQYGSLSNAQQIWGLTAPRRRVRPAHQSNRRSDRK